MSINYKSADPNAVGQKVMKDRALELERQAYAMETEVECLNRMLPMDPESEELLEMLERAKKDATRFRRAAVRASGAAPLSVEEINSCHETFLQGWLNQVETVHAEKMAFINEANRQLGLSGEDALNPEETMEIRVAIDALQAEVNTIEIRHHFCCEQLSSLSNDPELDDGLSLVDDLEEVET